MYLKILQKHPAYNLRFFARSGNVHLMKLSICEY